MKKASQNIVETKKKEEKVTCSVSTYSKNHDSFHKKSEIKNPDHKSNQKVSQR